MSTTFETQEEFEDAVMAVVESKLKVYLDAWDGKLTVSLQHKFDTFDSDSVVL